MSNAQVVWYENTDAGAPVLSGTAGALIGLLDAVLVNGWGLVSVTGIVVAGGVATVTTAAPHNLKDHGVVEVSGATPSGLNGRKRVLSRTTSTYTFSADGISDQTATGTIASKWAPAGWEKVFTGTNLAVYRSPDVTGTRQFLRIDDTTTTHATMWACESMTDVNTFADRWLNQFYIKSATANATAVTWRIFADHKTFYLQIRAGNNDGLYPFGDFTPVRANDPYACAARGAAASAVSSASNIHESISANYYCIGPSGGYPTPLAIPRSANFLSKSVSAHRRAEITTFPTAASTGQRSVSSGSAFGMDVPYPNTSDNALVFGTYRIHENNNSNLRGTTRGIYASPQVLAAHFALPVTTLDAQGALSGRKVAIVECSNVTPNLSFSSSADPSGRVIFDITGPWG